MGLMQSREEAASLKAPRDSGHGIRHRTDNFQSCALTCLASLFLHHLVASRPHSHDLSAHCSRKIGDSGIPDQGNLRLSVWKSELRESTGVKLQMLMTGGIQ